MAPEAAVSLRSVSKFHGSRAVLKNISLAPRFGALTLILGANGTGKTTLLRLIAGLIHPDAGVIKRHPRAKAAYLGHASFIYADLTAWQNMRFWAKAMQASEAEIEPLLERARLASHAHEKARHFSRGMTQRLNLARCLLGRPSLILLDEPFTGMDADSRALLAQEIAQRRSEGACVLMVSHDPDTDAKLADDMRVIENGRLTAPNPSSQGAAPC